MPEQDVACTEIVVRMITNKTHIDEDTGEVKPDAFVAKPVRAPDGSLCYETGVSVVILSRCPLHQAFETRLKGPPHRVYSLHAGFVKDSDLAVVQDKPEEDPPHAEIRGPMPPIADVKEMERWAGVLRDMARLHWMRIKR
jgi:hypothetical protein